MKQRPHQLMCTFGESFTWTKRWIKSSKFMVQARWGHEDSWGNEGGVQQKKTRRSHKGLELETHPPFMFSLQIEPRLQMLEKGFAFLPLASFTFLQGWASSSLAQASQILHPCTIPHRRVPLTPVKRAIKTMSRVLELKKSWAIDLDQIINSPPHLQYVGRDVG